MVRMIRTVWVLLGLVAGAAAVQSFAGLRDLAEMCGFAPGLAWLLPVTFDAGVAAGIVAWRLDHPPVRRFARLVTWTLLAASIGGNGTVHGLSAYHLAPPWWLVVVVSAMAPAIFGAVVHLAVQLRARPVVTAVGPVVTSAEPSAEVPAAVAVDRAGATILAGQPASPSPIVPGLGVGISLASPGPVPPPGLGLSDAELVGLLRTWAADAGRMPGRTAVQDAYRIGSGRAGRIRATVGASLNGHHLAGR